MKCHRVWVIQIIIDQSVAHYHILGSINYYT